MGEGSLSPSPEPRMHSSDQEMILEGKLRLERRGL